MTALWEAAGAFSFFTARRTFLEEYWLASRKRLEIPEMGEAEGGAEVFAEVDPVLFGDG